MIRGWKVKSARKEDPFANSAENGPEQGEMGGREDRRPKFPGQRFLSLVGLG